MTGQKAQSADRVLHQNLRQRGPGDFMIDHGGDGPRSGRLLQIGMPVHAFPFDGHEEGARADLPGIGHGGIDLGLTIDGSGSGLENEELA